MMNDITIYNILGVIILLNIMPILVGCLYFLFDMYDYLTKIKAFVAGYSHGMIFQFTVAAVIGIIFLGIHLIMT